MENQLWFLGTLEQLWNNTELPIRINASIPNGHGTFYWGMSGEGENPVVLPRRTTVEGIYASPVPGNGANGKAWNNYTADQLLDAITHRQTPESEFEFFE